VPLRRRLWLRWLQMRWRLLWGLRRLRCLWRLRGLRPVLLGMVARLGMGL
jgi:hypothetical protein